MSNGAPPLPVKPPVEPPKGSNEPALPEGAGPPSGGGDRRDEKCRKTEIKRVYDESGKYWVDVEQLKNATFKGSQWPGPDLGNQGQETILQLANSKLDGADEGCADMMEAGMNPRNPITGIGSGGEGAGEQAVVKVPARKASYVNSRNNIRRKMQNKKKPECCKDMKRRIGFNNISEKYLVTKQPSTPPKQEGGGGGGTEGERPPNQGPPPTDPTPKAQSLLYGGVPHSLGAAASPSGGGSSGGKVPPKDPKEYKEAVRKTDEGSGAVMDICIPKDAKLNRGGKRQQVKPKDMWKAGKVDMEAWVKAEWERYKAEQDRKAAAEAAAKAAGKSADTSALAGAEAVAGKAGAPSKNGPFFKLDMYQVPINFGPDALAVHFFDGEGPAKEPPPP